MRTSLNFLLLSWYTVELLLTANSSQIKYFEVLNATFCFAEDGLEKTSIIYLDGL